MEIIKLDEAQILKRYRPRAYNAHKGTLGHAVIAAGSYGKIGAAVLAAKAAMHSGCGLVTAFVPRCGYEIMQASLPEVMTLTDAEPEFLTKLEINFKPDAIGIGPGIGTASQTQQALFDYLQTVKSPVILDADALNIIALQPEEQRFIPEKSILTPHQKELERLLGSFLSESDKLELATEFSLKFDVVLVLKGAPTKIIYENKVYINTTGNQALATAGSGDVLTGIITGLCAQGYLDLDASLIGVYLHGLSSDIALPETGYEAFTASDIITFLGPAFKSLQQ